MFFALQTCEDLQKPVGVDTGYGLPLCIGIELWGISLFEPRVWRPNKALALALHELYTINPKK